MGSQKQARAAAEKLRNGQDDGDWFGCFECAALDSQFIGERMVLTFDARQHAELGERAPDTKSYGLGWRFLLKAKTESADDAAAWLFRVGDYQ
jgi:hypothetical protein